MDYARYEFMTTINSGPTRVEDAPTACVGCSKTATRTTGITIYILVRVVSISS